MPKNVQLGDFLETCTSAQCYQTGQFQRTKNGGKIQMRHFGVIFGRTVIPDRSFKIGQKIAENN